MGVSVNGPIVLTVTSVQSYKSKLSLSFCNGQNYCHVCCMIAFILTGFIKTHGVE